MLYDKYTLECYVHQVNSKKQQLKHTKLQKRSALKELPYSAISGLVELRKRRFF